MKFVKKLEDGTELTIELDNENTFNLAEREGFEKVEETKKK